jgi:SAM-dependent methyltransferase
MRKKRPLKFLADGRAMLNVACGSKMNWRWVNLDFSLTARLAHHLTIAKMLNRVGVLSEARYERLLRVDPEIILWDLKKGIPFPDESFDVVYSSHFLEHIDLEAVGPFLDEVYRVLKRRGTVRIVVPNLQALIGCYLSSVKKLESGDESVLKEHQRTVHRLFDQMVRTQSAGTSVQRPFVRAVERLVRGGPAKIGELHRWMYDKYTLRDLLKSVGFTDIWECDYCTSGIEGWAEFNLDSNDNGEEYKPDSLIMEGMK